VCSKCSPANSSGVSGYDDQRCSAYFISKAGQQISPSCRMTWTTSTFTYRRDEDKINAEAALDGISMIRTSVTDDTLNSTQAITAYKNPCARSVIGTPTAVSCCILTARLPPPAASASVLANCCAARRPYVANHPTPTRSARPEGDMDACAPSNPPVHGHMDACAPSRSAFTWVVRVLPRRGRNGVHPGGQRRGCGRRCRAGSGSPAVR
jgi:hypothetical protein